MQICAHTMAWGKNKFLAPFSAAGAFFPHFLPSPLCHPCKGEYGKEGGNLASYFRCSWENKGFSSFPISPRPPLFTMNGIKELVFLRAQAWAKGRNLALSYSRKSSRSPIALSLFFSIPTSYFPNILSDNSFDLPSGLMLALFSSPPRRPCDCGLWRTRGQVEGWPLRRGIVAGGRLRSQGR